jgi:hypothetical protein
VDLNIYLVEMAKRLDVSLHAKARAFPVKLPICLQDLQRDGDRWIKRRSTNISMANEGLIHIDSRMLES